MHEAKVKESAPKTIEYLRNLEAVPQTEVEKDENLRDFYTEWDRAEPNIIDLKEYENIKSELSELHQELIEAGKHFYEVTFENVGDIPMPIIVEFTMENGDTHREKLPAEVWKMDNTEITKVFVLPSKAVKVALDPNLETADIDVSNNTWPAENQMSRFDVFKKKEARGGNMYGPENPMQKANRAKEMN